MRRGLILLALALLTAFPCLGAEAEWELSGLDQVLEQAEQYGIGEETQLDQGLSGRLSDAAGQLAGLARKSAVTGLKLLAVVLLCALAGSMCPPDSRAGLEAVEAAGALSITALTMTDMASMVGLGRETLMRMDMFAQSLLPVMAMLTDATGGVTAAAARQGATVLFSQLLMTAMDRLLVPLVYAYVAVSCAAAAVDSPGLQKLAALVKSAAAFLLTALLLAFVGYLTASGAIAGSVDASAVKAAKLAISRAIPVVGGVLADASETVLAGAGALRGTVGVIGLLVVLAICLTPFLRLAAQYLLYKLTAALCAAVAQSRLSRLIDAIGGAVGLVLGMTGAGALVLLISLVSAVSAVVP